MSQILVIGVGNPNRGDDALGLEAALRLAARALPGVRVTHCSGDAALLLSAWEGAQRVILVDAAQTGAAPGTIRRLEAQRGPLPAALLHASTHSLGVVEAVELARALGRLPASLTVYAVEGAHFGHGGRLSLAVEAVLGEVVEQVAAEVEGRVCEQAPLRRVSCRSSSRVADTPRGGPRPRTC